MDKSNTRGLRWIGAAVLVFACNSAGAYERPNILLLVAEDMSPRVGAFGDGVAVTPHLDALAAEGVRYTNTFTTAGVCAPSRAAHILGMHQISQTGLPVQRCPRAQRAALLSRHAHRAGRYGPAL